MLTNDGAWADRVLHPRHGIEREYAIGLRAPLTGDQVAALKAGIALDEGLATLTGLRPTTDIETRRLVDARRAAARRPGLVSRHPGAGLEAPAAPDVRCGRRADRAAGPGADRAGPARRSVERSCASAAGAGGPGPGRGSGDEPGGRQGWRARRRSGPNPPPTVKGPPGRRR